ncbi:hypothetical protein Hanom_Chr09g00775711 [Helianthus anomalus]
MDSVGEGEGVIRRMEKALAIAKEEKKENEARDYDVEGYIRTPLSRMKLFGTDEHMVVVVPTVKVKEMGVVV